MKKIKLDRETVTKLMEEVVAEKGEDYALTDGCRYVEGSEPVCIVGHVLIKAGLDPEFFYEPYDSYGTFYNNSSLEAVLSRDKGENIEIPFEVVQALSSAQRVQDNNISWGKALQKYKNSLAYFDTNPKSNDLLVWS